MKKILAAACLTTASLSASNWQIYAGPHFNYTSFEFNNPELLEGYMAGVTAGFGSGSGWFYYNVDFEGSWNAAPIRGNPCQTSSLAEYFLELKVGACFSWCCDKFRFRPYSGFGWDRFLNEQDPETAALCYRYDTLFVPVGFYLDWVFCDRDTVSLQFEWRPDVYARLHLLSIELDSSRKQAFRGQMPIKWNWDRACCGLSFAFIPFFDWKEFGKVQEKNSLGVSVDIPALKRWNLGVRAVFNYQF